MENFNAVILADGDFPVNEKALHVLRSASYLCCCDHAGKRYLERLESGELQGYPYPDAIIGDGDSVTADFREKHCDIYHQVTEQDYNDLTKATRFVISQLITLHLSLHIAYLGTSGMREDHTINNIFLLPFYQRELNVEAEFITDYGTFVCGVGEQTFDSFPHQQVSIFNISCKTLSGSGLKWDPYCFRELWQGTLNESLSSEFTLNGDGQYIVYRTHEPKV